jgi:Predicted membrane protein
MESRVKIFGHAVHPILVVFPLGLLATAVIFDVVYLITGDAAMALIAFWMIGAGLIGGAIAAPFGWIDWFAIAHGTRAKRIGLVHGLGNVIVLVLFFVSWWFRYVNRAQSPEAIAMALSFAGAGLAIVTGWLGGELVQRLGVGIDTGANLNAPSSLSSERPTVPLHEKLAGWMK